MLVGPYFQLPRGGLARLLRVEPGPTASSLTASVHGAAASTQPLHGMSLCDSALGMLQGKQPCRCAPDVRMLSLVSHYMTSVSCDVSPLTSDVTRVTVRLSATVGNSSKTRRTRVLLAPTAE